MKSKMAVLLGFSKIVVRANKWKSILPGRLIPSPVHSHPQYVNTALKRVELL